MTFRIGIDVGGTFTDFPLADGEGNYAVYKVSTTPRNPAEGVFDGLAGMAADRGLFPAEFFGQVEAVAVCFLHSHASDHSAPASSW